MVSGPSIYIVFHRPKMVVVGDGGSPARRYKSHMAYDREEPNL
jgi:hypothetical protein